MTIETEQIFLAEISDLNAEWWSKTQSPETEKIKEKLVLKYGSKTVAIEETFFLLWRGFQLSVSMLSQKS